MNLGGWGSLAAKLDYNQGDSNVTNAEYRQLLYTVNDAIVMVAKKIAAAPTPDDNDLVMPLEFTKEECLQIAKAGKIALVFCKAADLIPN